MKTPAPTVGPGLDGPPAPLPRGPSMSDDISADSLFVLKRVGRERVPWNVPMNEILLTLRAFLLVVAIAAKTVGFLAMEVAAKLVELAVLLAAILYVKTVVVAAAARDRALALVRRG